MPGPQLPLHFPQRGVTMRVAEPNQTVAELLSMLDEHLITGDADLRALHAFRTVQIVSPHSFLNA